MVYDTLLFCNEVELLKLRLTELWDVVDKFVLVESRTTHRGGEKPLFYRDNRSDFDQWNEKIDSCIVTFHGLTGDSVHVNGLREHAARKALDGYAFNPDSTIIYSDADEIVRPDVVRRYADTSRLCWCEPRFYHFYFNLLEEPTPPGARPVIAPARIFKEIGFEKARWEHGYSPVTKAPMIPDSGWHFSYLGGAVDLRYKISCAVEGSSSDWIGKESDATIQSRIEAGKQYDGNQQFKFVEVDGSFPKYVRDNLEALTEKKLVKLPQPA
jgi:beta-1,4-mannosyl-glycoprotein beta-1,4-N-acetylglucosaminyltransferase